LIEALIAYLYEIIERESKKLGSQAPTVKAGFKLEDSIALDIAEFCTRNRLDNVTPYPPRYKLDQLTLTGQKHQFDFIIQCENTFFVGECKRRKGVSTKDQLLSFGAKLLDYGLGARVHKQNSFYRGIFLSTAKIPDGSATYALGCGIIPITPSFPPIEYLLAKIGKGRPLWRHLNELKKELCIPWPSILDIANKRRYAYSMLESYKQYYTLWREEAQ